MKDVNFALTGGIIMLENNLNENYLEPFNIEKLAMSFLPNKKKKIMVVDDDQDFRISLCEMLVDKGFKVTTAKDGEVALNNLIFENDLPDLILLDVVMPVKSGIEFRQDQLKFDGISDIPVIFMSGFHDQAFVDSIQKPFDWDLLMEKMSLFL